MELNVFHILKIILFSYYKNNMFHFPIWKYQQHIKKKQKKIKPIILPLRG